MSALTSEQRKALSDSDFALSGRRYPIDTENRARDALARVQQNGTPDEKRRVYSAVRSKYPGMNIQTAPMRRPTQ